jgi:hypothetical protein
VCAQEAGGFVDQDGWEGPKSSWKTDYQEFALEGEFVNEEGLCA